MITLRDLLRHALSAKGLVTIAAAVLATVAIVLDGAVATVVGLVAVLLAAAAILAVSTGLTVLRKRGGPPARTTVGSGRGTGLDQSSDEVGDDPLHPVRASLRRLGPAVDEASSGDTVAAVPRGDGPLVTVVVPCFNERLYIEDAIRSVVAQSHDDWELIVVDDASTDQTPALALAAAGRDERITVVRHRVNGGLSAARNTGLRLARGRYVTFLDGDDLLTRDSLEDRVATLAGVVDPDVVGTFCGVRFGHESVRLDDLEPSYPWNPRGRIDFVSARGECPFNAHAPMLRTSVVRAAGGFDESMRDGAEDWDMWSRLLRGGFAFVPSTSATAIYRQKPGSMVREKLARHVDLSAALLDGAYESFDADVLPVRTHAPFTDPLPIYERQVKRAIRVLRSAVLALVGDDEGSATALVAQLAAVPRAVVDHHATIDRAVLAGVRRAYGLEPSDLAELAAELGPLRARLAMLVDHAVPATTPGIVHGPTPEVDVLAVPANASQARQMVDAARADAVRTWAFVDVARTSGDQGVAEVLEASGMPAVSVNEWALSRSRARAVVVATPRLAAVEEIVAEAGDATVVELTVDGRSVLDIDEVPTRASVPVVGRGELAAVLEAGAPGALGGPWHLRGRAAAVAWRAEEYPRTTIDAASLASFRDLHKGERCVIIGNGPSLNDLDLVKLRDEATIGVNGIFYKTDEVGIDLLYYVVEDTAVVDDNLDRIRTYTPRGHRFFPSIYRDKIGERPDTTFFMMNRGFYAPESPDYCVPRFATDIRQRVFTGQSVTIINLQLAYWMGFAEVVLIGMDFSYTIPDDAERRGDLITSAGDDPNHFHPDYFGKGKVWKDPKLDRVLSNYQLAKLMFEADGRRIVNATAGGKLELFDRVDYDALF